MFNRDALFGGRSQPSPLASRRPPQGREDSNPFYGQQFPASSNGGPRGQPDPANRVVQLRPAKSPEDSFTFGNMCAVNPQDITLSGDTSEIYLLINGAFVLSARPVTQFPRGHISLSDAQRTWMQVALIDTVDVQQYHPFAAGAQCYLGSVDVEIGFAGRKSTDAPYDQDELAQTFVHTFRNQIFAPGQQLLMDFRSIPLRLTIRTAELVDIASLKTSDAAQQSTDPGSRGIVTPETVVNFFKDAKSALKLKGSTRRPAANSVLRPDFKFEDMGIGGLDKEFSVIFRRAFASRVFPPGLIEQLGIQHVRGMLLYGPPGTGKTLIARQIGKLLNAREPKVINGPEVLNKYVGQSEENIRKLFADAEKEQKEKGDESGLHIIIFDELDAVCKQRGSGAGGGTGVGDSVVNQLLSKLDGVEQLNNILLIGMTNRKDMIDEALLRPGRLEVHVEISLPDEHGRAQILKIHTTKMKESGKMASDVDLAELARLTRNFSGAEISGLVKSAGSLALQRHIKVGTFAAPSDDINQTQVRMQDFLTAVDEVRPLYGANEEDLERCIEGGILHFSDHIDRILADSTAYVNQVRTGRTPLLSVLFHGPAGSGKTALASKIAIDSEYPFVRLIRPIDMLGMNEMQKIQHLNKVFTDAYKSPLNVIVLDGVEDIVEWSSVGPRFSVALLGAIKAVIRNKPPKKRSLLIIATTSQLSVARQLQLDFDAEIAVPNVQTQDELAYIMKDTGVFEPNEIAHVLRGIEDVMQTDRIGISVRRVLLAAQTVVDSEDRTDKFIDAVCAGIHAAAR